MDFIEMDSITDEMEVSYGRTNTEVTGDNAEFAQLNEKVSYFDLAFRAKNPVLTKAGVQAGSGCFKISRIAAVLHTHSDLPEKEQNIQFLI